jgi:hypothetical protein
VASLGYSILLRYVPELGQLSTEDRQNEQVEAQVSLSVGEQVVAASWL